MLISLVPEGTTSAQAGSQDQSASVTQGMHTATLGELSNSAMLQAEKVAVPRVLC